MSRLGTLARAITAALGRRGRGMRWALIAVVAATLGAGGVAFAASLNVNSEHLTVYTNTLATPTVSVGFVPAPPITVGGSAQVSAMLSGQTSNAGGTVTYAAYDDSACMTPYAPIAPELVEVTGFTVPDSMPLLYTLARTYYWKASYSGDGNHRPSASPCTEFVVAQATPTMELMVPSPALIGEIAATATLDGAYGVAGQMVNFTISGPNVACGAEPLVGIPGTLMDQGGGVFKADVTLDATQAGSYFWTATYLGDSNNQWAEVSCFAVTVS